MLLKLEDIINNQFRVINGIYVHPNICLDSVVYKYIPKKYFYNMMQSQQLYVANRAQFSDMREKHWKENFKMRFLITPASLSQEEKQFYGNLSKKIDETYALCISCWTYDKHKDCDESIINWKCYGEDTYRIETTIEDLIWCIHPTDKKIIFHQFCMKRANMTERSIMQYSKSILAIKMSKNYACVCCRLPKMNY